MSKDAGGFLRKVVRFVANPTTDWSALDMGAADLAESEYAKTEIKAMIERKRRNDFVRKRELDMLRKVRREGLSPDNALAMGGSSNLEADSRPHNGARSDIAVKAKIDEIEQQMVGGSGPRSRPATPIGQQDSHASGHAQFAPTLPDKMVFDREAMTAPATLPGLDFGAPRPISRAVPAASKDASYPSSTNSAQSRQSQVLTQPGVELVHDPELDESVIAFANADFDQCERCLVALIQPDGDRHRQNETWLVLLDFYRALDLPQKFEPLSLSYAQHFGMSAPQWYSLPNRVAALHAAQNAADPNRYVRDPSDVTDGSAVTEPGIEPSHRPIDGWVAPAVIDHEAVTQLRVLALQLPQPWTMDWRGVHSITAQGAGELSELAHQWAQASTDMHWIGADSLLAVLAEATPTGSRDIDPALWMLRLNALILCNRAVDFDEVAIDYCITYESSPPSWEAPKCKVQLQKDALQPHTQTLSLVSEVTTSFVESRMLDEVEFVQVSALNLSGQLVGDIGSTLAQLDGQLGSSATLVIHCEHLLRVDFIAAGDLLNWVLARRAEGRKVTFLSAHRVVAMFFGAMGINEHASIRLQIS